MRFSVGLSVQFWDKLLRSGLNSLIVSTKVGVLLDSIGRQILSTMDYRVYGLLILVLTGGFCVYRKLRYRSWPAHQDCITFVLSLGAMIGAITVLIVFLLTKPPAIDLLPTGTIVIIGVVVPIIICGNASPKLRALLFPPRAPAPPSLGNCEIKPGSDTERRD